MVLTTDRRLGKETEWQDWKNPMKELERLRAQNKILRELLDTFIDATHPDQIELSTQKILQIRMKSMSLLKRIDDFDTKRFSTTGNN